MGFSRQEYWSGVPHPSLGDLPDLGIEPASLSLAGDSLPLSHQGSQRFFIQKQISEINSCIKDEFFSSVFPPLCLFLWVVLIFIFGHVRQLAESQFPNQDLNLGPQQWKLHTPATGPPRNFQFFLFDQKMPLSTSSSATLRWKQISICCFWKSGTPRNTALDSQKVTCYPAFNTSFPPCMQLARIGDVAIFISSLQPSCCFMLTWRLVWKSQQRLMNPRGPVFSHF